MTDHAGEPDDRIAALAREVFGWDALRPAQRAAVDAAAGGRDTLVVMPPGSGKSAVFQLAGMLRGGLTVVVSPLLALQRDQVQALANRPGTVRAAVLNSTLSAHQRTELLQRGTAGELDFLYLGPEQFARDDVTAALCEAKPTLLAVDEAHCVSQWGHDFRPDYLHIARAVAAVGRPPVCATTATASPPVRAEIVDRLGLTEVVESVAGFDRPEIHLRVTPPESAEAKRAMIVEQAAGLAKPLLVYVATRAETAELADELAGLGLQAAAYHGGDAARRRTQVEKRWLAGELDVVVATNAFGMGVDKPDVRTVVHADPPDSLDFYLQEIGRAARDGAPAEALLVWRPEDLGVRRFFAGGMPSARSLATLAAAVHAAGRPVSVPEIATELGWTRARVERLLDLLIQAGRLQMTEELVSAVPGHDDPQAAAAAAREVATARQTVEASRIDMVRAFAETRGCRRQLLLASFGETLAEPCGNCDTCDAGLPEAEVTDQADSPFPVGGPVSHAEWGHGLVIRYDGDRVTVLFDSVGYRTLDLATVAEHHLLS